MAILSAAASTAAAQARGGHLPNVKRLYEQLYFSEAMTACQAALQAGRLSRHDLLETLRFRGLIAASTGDEGAAADSFKRALAIDPDLQLGREHAPRIRRPFELARRWIQQRGGIRLEVKAPASARRAAPITISAAVSNDPLQMVTRLALYLRGSGTASFVALPGAAGPAAGWTVEPGQIDSLRQAASLEYFVAGFDEAGSQVALVGSQTAPSSVGLLGPPLLPPSTPTLDRRGGAVPLVRRWWFWTAIGAVVALGTGLGVGLGTRRAADSVNAPVTIESGR